jgi:pentatricopeptide repeat protein
MSGDGESAYSLFKDIMSMNSMTKLDQESYILLLKACVQTFKGRYYAKLVIQELENDKLISSKHIWDYKIQLNIYNNQSFYPTLANMIKNNFQPDEDTFLSIISVCDKLNRIDSIMKVYELLSDSEKLRRKLIKTVLSSSRPLEVISDLQSESSSFREIDANLDDETLYSVLVRYAPIPTKRITHNILKSLRDKTEYEKAVDILKYMISRSFVIHENQDTPASLRQKSFDIEDTFAVTPVTLTVSGKQLLSQQLNPDIEDYALVIEACVYANQSDMALDILSMMERGGITPDRRIYSAMIQAFGLRQDIPSALGVFEELKTKFIPDASSLHSLLMVCSKNSVNLRQVVGVLEKLSDEGYDLDVYSNDIIMQSFPDSLSLGKTLEKMIELSKLLVMKEGYQEVSTSFSVLSALVQARRTAPGLEEIVKTMEYLGSIGIIPDSGTMEYFRMSEIPMRNAPFSSHYTQKLQPNSDKQRSLLRDIDLPDDSIPDLSMFSTRPVDQETKIEFSDEPNMWTRHTQILQKAMIESVDENGNFDIDALDEEEMDQEELLSLNELQTRSEVLTDDITKHLDEPKYDELSLLTTEIKVPDELFHSKTNTYGNESTPFIDSPSSINNKGSVTSVRPVKPKSTSAKVKFDEELYEMRNLFSGQQRPTKRPNSDIWTPDNKKTLNTIPKKTSHPLQIKNKLKK